MRCIIGGCSCLRNVAWCRVLDVCEAEPPSALDDPYRSASALLCKDPRHVPRPNLCFQTISRIRSWHPFSLAQPKMATCRRLITKLIHAVVLLPKVFLTTLGLLLCPKPTSALNLSHDAPTISPIRCWRLLFSELSEAQPCPYPTFLPVT